MFNAYLKNLIGLTLVLFALSGCGDLGGGGGSDDNSGVDVVPLGEGKALVTWMPPTANNDSSLLTDLAGFRIYFGTSSGTYLRSVDVDNPGTSSYLIEQLASSEWYFAMTAYNNSGVESPLSPEVSATIEFF